MPWDPGTAADVDVDPVPFPVMGWKTSSLSMTPVPVQFTFRNDADPIDSDADAHDPTNQHATPLIIEISVDGPANDFLVGLTLTKAMRLLAG